MSGGLWSPHPLETPGEQEDPEQQSLFPALDYHPVLVEPDGSTMARVGGEWGRGSRAAAPNRSH